MSHIEFVPAIKQQLFDVFGFHVTATKITGGVEVDAGSSCTVSFAMLTKLSEIFGTMKIDVNSQIISGGYCETCSYEETVVRIQIFEPTHDLGS
jgi:hypothetical protein